MLRLFRILFGAVTICLSKEHARRFLNLCRKKEIDLWKLQFKSNDQIQMSLWYRDYDRLEPILQKINAKVVLLEKRGLPFFYRRHKIHFMFGIGLCLCVISIICLNLFIWKIQLSLDGGITKEMILDELAEANITYGTRKSKIDLIKLQEKVKEAFPSVTWVGLEVKGTKLSISIRENTNSNEEEINQNQTRSSLSANDLIATTSGRIHSIVTQIGVPKVKAGDEVKKGDVLVSGKVPIMNDDQTLRTYIYRNAKASILLETNYQYQKEIPLRQRKRVYTGKSNTLSFVRINHSMFCMEYKKKYPLYEVETTIHQLKLYDDFYIPLYWGRINYLEYEEKEEILTEKKAERILVDEFLNFCKSLQQKGIQITGKNVKIKKIMDKMRLECKLGVITQDGQPEAIKICSTD